MGLLDKAKEKKQDEGPVPEPEVTEDVASTDAEKTDASPKKKLKKKSGMASGKKKLGKKPSSKKGGKKSPLKKKASSMKRPSRPKKEKVVKEPEIEGLPENLEFATIPKRAMAQVFDGIILGLTLLIILIVLVIAIEDVGLYIWLVLYFIIPPAYYIAMEGGSGQTIGKGMAHVKVLSLDGRKLTTGKVMKSAGMKGLLFPFVNIIDAILGVFVLHAESRQRYTQYEDDLIVIAVEKKKLKYVAAMDEEESEGEGDEAVDEEGVEAPIEEEPVA